MQFLLSIPTKYKLLLIVLTDVLISLLSLILSSYFVYGVFFNYVFININLILICLSFVIFFYFFGIYKKINRYFSLADFKVIFYATALYTLFVLLALFNFNLLNYNVNNELIYIYVIIFLVIILLSRIGVLTLVQNSLISRQRKKIIIYGTGDSAYQTLQSIRNYPDYQTIAFVDNNKNMIGRNINGIKVYSHESVEEIIRTHDISDILLTTPLSDIHKRKELIKFLNRFNIGIRLLPSINDLVSGKVTISDFKNIDVRDILDRKIEVNTLALNEQFKNKTVLITGAGGSIGSELSIQLVKLNLSKIILLDHSEFNLYKIQTMLEEKYINKSDRIEVISILSSINDPDRLNNIFQNYKPDYVFHAAAYKHVPIVEENIVDSVKNNVFGSLNLLIAALNHKVKKFILISTDKAVNPTSVMGATKRISEMFVQAYANDQKDKTKSTLSIVRFGNVLDSSGSIIPLFREQLKAGGPLTVTHPEMKRFFMLISEAVGLILETSIISKGGEVFVLNMGNPVSILELAKKMINLSGNKVKDEKNDQGIKIEFTGLRKGEKLSEELFIDDKYKTTENKEIFIAHEEFKPIDELNIFIADLKKAVQENNQQLIIDLMSVNVTGFKYKIS